MTKPIYTHPEKKLKVINLFGAPGRGKSAVRSGIFWLMKSHHFSVEEVSEYAKYLVLTGRFWQLQEEQLYLLAKQHHKQLITERNGYEFAVTDSPLQLCSFYAPTGYYDSFHDLIDESGERFENINFFLTRDISSETAVFEDRGRTHDREASIQAENDMREFLAQKGIEYTDMSIDLYTPWRIVEAIAPGKVAWPKFV